jgi:hypothetical protein
MDGEKFKPMVLDYGFLLKKCNACSLINVKPGAKLISK